MANSDKLIPVPKELMTDDPVSPESGEELIPVPPELMSDEPEEKLIPVPKELMSDATPSPAYGEKADVKPSRSIKPGGIRDYRKHPLWDLIDNALPLMEYRKKVKALEELDKEEKRREDVKSKVIKEDDSSSVGAWLGGVVGTATQTLFGGSSTNPSKYMTEVQAARTKEGDRSPSFDAAMGSVVGIAKEKLSHPIDTLMQAAINPSGLAKDVYDKFTPFDQEDARKKILRTYSTPIIDQYGYVNKESLDYSDLPRWLQNELTTVWAAQRTNAGNPEFFRDVLSSRGGILENSSDTGAFLKRVVQPIDRALFNIPSKGVEALSTGSDKDALIEDYPVLFANDARGAITPGAVKLEQNGNQWVAHLMNGDRVPLDFDPTKMDETARKTAIHKAIWKDTLDKVQNQAFEPYSNVIDPTMLFGIGGAVKKGIAALLGKAGMMRASAIVARDVAGAGELAARAASTSSTLMKAPGLSAATKAIIDTAKSNTTSGWLLRSMDKTLTNTAAVSALAYAGSTETSGSESAIGAALFSIGLTPLHIMAARHPTNAAFQQPNKDFLNEVARTPKFADLSDYSKKKVERATAKTVDPKLDPETRYQSFRNSALSPERIDEIVGPYVEHIRKSPMNAAGMNLIVENLMENERFQILADEGRVQGTDMGINNAGREYHTVHKQVLIEERNHATKFKGEQEEAVKQMTGGGNIVPPSYPREHMLKNLEALADNMPPWLINDRAKTNAWLDGAITGNPLPDHPSIGHDTAVALRAQLGDRPKAELYRTDAIRAVILGAALREMRDTPSPATKAIVHGGVMQAEEKLVDFFDKLPFDEKVQLFNDLKGIDTGFMEGEGIIGTITRRADKNSIDSVSPSAAAKILTRDFQENFDKLPKLIEQEKQIRADAKSVTDPKQKQLMLAAADSIMSQIRETRKNPLLYKMYQWAQDTQKKFVETQGKIHEETLKVAGLAPFKTMMDESKLPGMEQARKEYRELLERRRIESIREYEELAKKAKENESRLSVATHISQNRAQMAEIAVAQQLGQAAAKGVAATILGKVVTKSGKPAKLKSAQFNERTRQAVNSARSARATERNYQRLKKLYDDAEATYSTRKSDTKKFLDEMTDTPVDIANIPADKLHSDGAVWFDESLSGAEKAGITKTPFYLNLKSAILDDIADARAKLSQTTQNSQVVSYSTPIKPEHIAALRLMADENWMIVYGNGAKTNRVLTQQVNLLADHLEAISRDSILTEGAIRILDETINNHKKTSLSELWQAYKDLRDNQFAGDLVKDKGNTIKQLGELLEGRSNGKLTYADWVFLYRLSSDSTESKGFFSRGYQSFLEKEGIEAPWVITYKQEIPRMMQTLVSMSDELVDDAMKKTSQYLVDTGMLVDPSEFELKVAAGFFADFANASSVPMERMLDLMMFAKAWHDKQGILGIQFRTTEEIAVISDRDFGGSVHRDFYETMAASRIAGEERRKHIGAMVGELERLSHDGVSYISVAGPRSNVRNAMVISMTPTEGHSAIPTPYKDFIESGYSNGVSIYMQDGKEVLYLTDHLVVDGQLTAMGKAYQKWAVSNDSAKDFATKIVDDLNHKGISSEEKGKLTRFIASQLEMYTQFGKMTATEFKLYFDAMKILQRYDKEGLAIINAKNQQRNVVDKTHYADIDYQPWRLDGEVPHKGENVSVDPVTLGTYKDADRIMGSRYGTNPENQIAKAKTTHYRAVDVTISPEEIAANRFTKLVNEVYSRRARRSLSRTAQLMEMTGYREMAKNVRDYVIAPNTGVDMEATIVDQLSEAIDRRDFTQAGDWVGMMYRQAASPFIGLASPRATVIEQPIQSALLTLTQRFGPSSLVRAIQAGYTGVKEGLKAVPTMLSGTFTKNMRQLDLENNGMTIPMSIDDIGLAKEILTGLTQRTNPVLEAYMRETRRHYATGKLKEKSYNLATSTGLESVNAKLMLLSKEASETRNAMVYIPQAFAIWKQVEKAMKGGQAAVHNKLAEYMTGSLANEAFIMQLSKMATTGEELTAKKLFTNFYVNQNVGVWSHANIPKAWRKLARTLPGADQFYHSATMSLHRAILSLSSMENLSIPHRAAAIASVMATFGTATGLMMLSKSTGIQWFNRLNPSPLLGTAGTIAMGGEFDDEKLGQILSTLGTRTEVRAGMTQAVKARQLQAVLGLISSTLAHSANNRMTPLERDRSLDAIRSKFIQAFLDQTLLRPMLLTAGRTPREFIVELQSIHDGMAASTLDETDAIVLKHSLEVARAAAKSVNKRYKQAQYETDNNLLSAGELLSIKLLGAFATMSRGIQEGVADEDSDFAKVQTDVDPFERNLARGERRSDVASTKLLQVLEKALTEYEADKKRRSELLTRPKPIPLDQITDVYDPRYKPKNTTNK